MPGADKPLNDAGPIVLIADDEEAIRRVLRLQLRARGYRVAEAGTGGEILRTERELRPDVILLDLGLPDMDGVEVARRVRGAGETPIIVLSVRSAGSDKVAALEAGADDYLTKPCPIGELLERIRAALFRIDFDGQHFESGDLTVDLNLRLVRIGDKRIQLTLAEYELLQIFVLNAGRLLTPHRLANELYGGSDSDEEVQLLQSTVQRLRRKLTPDPTHPCYIAIEPGVGYRLACADVARHR